MKQNSQNLTHGAPAKSILKFCLPLYAGNFFVLLYNVFDIIIIGRLLGTAALAGVGSVTTIMFIMQGFMLGFSTGFSIVPARLYKTRSPDFKKSVAASVVLALLFALVLSALFLLFMPKILVFLNTDQKFYNFAYSYIMVISAGLVVMTSYNLLDALLRAVSISKISMYISAAMLVLSVGLDFVFIKFLHLSTAGAALSTIVSFFVCSVILLLYIIIKVPELHVKKSDFKFSKQLSLTLLKNAIPMSLQHSAKGIGAAFVQSSFNLFGKNAVAAVSVFLKLEHISTDAFVSLGHTMSVFCAQNLGANKTERIKKGIKSAFLIGGGFVIITTILLFAFSKYSVPIFVKTDISSVKQYLTLTNKIITPFFALLCFVIISRYSMQGLGFSYLALTPGAVELIIRIVMSYISKRANSFTLTAFCYPASWAGAALSIIVIYIILKNRYLKKL